MTTSSYFKKKSQITLFSNYGFKIFVKKKALDLIFSF